MMNSSPSALVYSLLGENRSEKDFIVSYVVAKSKRAAVAVQELSKRILEEASYVYHVEPFVLRIVRVLHAGDDDDDDDDSAAAG